MKKSQKNINRRSKDRQTVVLEEMNSKFDLVLEQFSNLNRKIDGNHQEFLEFKGEMTEFKGEMTEFKGEMTEFKGEMTEFRDRTDENLAFIKAYLIRIDEEIQNMKIEAKELKTRLKNKADLVKLADLEKRMVKLEKLVFAKLA